MKYDPLPESELIRKPKELPKWWYEIDKVSIGPPAKDGLERDKNISGIEAVYRCLSETKRRLPCRDIAELIAHREVSVTKWLHKLLEADKITYDEVKQRKFWRLLRPGETHRRQPSGYRHGVLRNRILKLLEQIPHEWLSPVDLRPMLGLGRTGTIIQSCDGLWRNGEIQRRPDPAIMKHPRRHLYQYRLGGVSSDETR